MNKSQFAGSLRGRFKDSTLSEKGIPISIKVRHANMDCMGGCCWPNALLKVHKLVEKDSSQSKSGKRVWQYEEHESGPEIIFMWMNGAGLVLGALQVIIGIIQIYSNDRNRHGRTANLEVTARGFTNKDELFDELVMKIDPSHLPDTDALNAAIVKAIKPYVEKPLEKTHAKDTKPVKSVAKKKKKAKRKVTVAHSKKQSKKKTVKRNKRK